MSKWHEVTVKQTKVFAVEIKDGSPESATDVVIQELCGDDWYDIESVEHPEGQVEALLRHTDKDKILSL